MARRFGLDRFRVLEQSLASVRKACDPSLEACVRTKFVHAAARHL